MKKAIKIEFSIAAGKMDGGEVNWNYIDSATDCTSALEKHKSCNGYPVVEFHVETTWSDGTLTRAPAFGGGVTEELCADGIWRVI